MELTTLMYIFVGGSFALYFGIAIWAKAGSTGEFYAAGRGVHPIANGMATAADWMSAASFISMAGLIAFMGYDASLFLMGWTGGYVLLALLLAPYLRKFGKYTVPEFVGDRFYSTTARVVAVFCLIVASLTYVIGQVKGIGVAFSRFLEVDFVTGLWIGMAIVAVYAILGGMKGVTYTQIAQYCVLITAYTVPAIFISLNLTGNPIPPLGLFSSTADGTPMLAKLNQIIGDLGFSAFTEQKRNTVDLVFYTFSLMIGTAGLPHVIIRFFTVPRVRDARATAGWALFFIAILYTTAPAVGAMARLNLMTTIQTSEVGADGGQQLAYAERPQWFKNWEATGLLKFEDKNGDGKIQYYNDKSEAFNAKAAAWGWKGNEMVKVDNDIMVLANPEIAQLPNWVIALVAAGGLAAALSTAAGLLLAISSSVAHDLLKSTFMPDISEKNELLSARIAMAVSIVIAGFLGMNPPGFAAQTVALAFGLAASSIFPVLMMGIFSKKMNKAGAVAGMLTGVSTTLLYIFAFKGFFFVKGTELWANTPANHFFGISPEAFGTVGAMLNFLVAFIVMNMTAPCPDHIQHMVEDIRVPKGSGAAIDH
jgi:cation/acetate symporter